MYAGSWTLFSIAAMPASLKTIAIGASRKQAAKACGVGPLPLFGELGPGAFQVGSLDAGALAAAALAGGEAGGALDADPADRAADLGLPGEALLQ